MIDVEGVVHTARRMRRWHIECFKVVPIGFNFGAFSYLEAQSDENIFKSLPSLRHDVGFTPTWYVEMFSEIERFSSKLNITFGTTQQRSARIENFFDRQHCLVERLTCRLFFINRRQFAKPSLQQSQRAFLAQQIGVENAKLI